MTHEAWVDAALAPHGLRRTGPLGAPRERSWSTVWRVPTSDGTVWLKVPAAALAYEVGLYRVLLARDPEAVLEPLGAADGRLLLPDGGPSARDAYPDDVDARLGATEAALPRYAELQRRLAPAVGELLAAGLPDMRPAAMPAHLDAVAAFASADDAATRDALTRLRAACERLARDPGGVTVDHADLHDNNVLAGPRFYDWGDAVVGHPFGSLLVPLGMAVWELGCDPADRRVVRLRDAYLEAWDDVGSHAERVAIAERACGAARVARALGFRRALRPGSAAWRGAVPGVLGTLRDPSPYAVA